MSFSFSIGQQPVIFPTPTSTNAEASAAALQTLPADVLRHCLCHYCRCYANVAPVRFVNDQIACGRCLSAGDGVQLLIVEALVKMHRFPCRYEELGCRMVLQCGAVESHERSCDYKKVACTISGCIWTGRKNGIHVHFQDRHVQQIVDGKVSISINIKESKTYNLLYMKRIPYLVNIVCDGKSIQHDIKSFCTDLEAMQIYYDIKFSANYCDLSFNKQRAQSYDSSANGGNKAIPVALLSAVFGDDSIVNINISIWMTTAESAELLNAHDIECPVCMEMMLGQIFVRKCGHSMCGTCSGNLQESPCPVCRSARTITSEPSIFAGPSQHNSSRRFLENFKARNYNLEKIIQKVHSLI